MTRLRLLLIVITGAVVVGGCASRPSSEKLAEAILVSTTGDESTQITPEQALCIADELLATGLSDTTLSGLADDFANPTVLETEVNAVEPAVTAAALVCR